MTKAVGGMSGQILKCEGFKCAIRDGCKRFMVSPRPLTKWKRFTYVDGRCDGYMKTHAVIIEEKRAALAAKK